MIKFFILLIAMVLSTVTYAAVEIPVSVDTGQLQSPAELGKVLIEGIGEVSLVARKNGNQLVIHAQDKSGKVIGKAETVSGLKETPIFVLTPEGLKKINIIWGVNAP